MELFGVEVWVAGEIVGGGCAEGFAVEGEEVEAETSGGVGGACEDAEGAGFRVFDEEELAVLGAAVFVARVVEGGHVASEARAEFDGAGDWEDEGVAPVFPEGAERAGFEAGAGA